MSGRLGGLRWMIREFGLRATVRYEWARWRGAVIDYRAIFTRAELDRLAEVHRPNAAPWEEYL